MTQAIWNGTVIAESDDVIVVNGYHYFPRDAVDPTYLHDSDHTSVCGWKGQARYHHIVVNGKTNEDAAWYYPTPSAAAAALQDRIGFWRGVKVAKGPGDRRSLRDRLRRPGASRGTTTTTPPASVDAVAELDDENFEPTTAGEWTIVDFYAPWCGPCRTFHPVFDDIAASHKGHVRFARCNVDNSPTTASKVQILSIPTLILFDAEGNEARRLIGVPPRKDFEQLIANAEMTATLRPDHLTDKATS